MPHAHQQHLILRLSGYTEQQLSSIVQSMLSAKLKDMVQRGTDRELTGREKELYLAAAQRWGVQQQGSGGSLKKNSSSVEVVQRAAQLVQESIFPQIAEAVKASFRSVLNVALPILMCTSTHPTVLFDASTACYTAMYGAIPEDLLSRIVQQYVQTAPAMAPAAAPEGAVTADTVVSPAARKSVRGTPSSTTKGQHPAGQEALCVNQRALAALTAHYLPPATVSGVRAAVRLVHHLPAYSCAAPEVVCLGKRKGVQLERPALAVSETGEQMQGLTGSGGLSNTQTPPACELESLDTTTSKPSSTAL
jgi:hypothetical protein